MQMHGFSLLRRRCKSSVGSHGTVLLDMQPLKSKNITVVAKGMRMLLHSSPGVHLLVTSQEDGLAWEHLLQTGK